ncbi:MAG: response regulator [bacterium]|nr:response regulator [bacterium]
MKTLIAVANPERRELLETALRSRGHEVTSHAEAESVWENFEREARSLVLVEWTAQPDSLRLCRRIRSSSHGGGCLILILLGPHQQGDLSAAIEAGVDDFLTTPLVPEVLDARLALAERRAEKVAERKQAEAERRELEARIRQMQKMESLGVLAGGIAHDFNNLLMGVLGNADLALLRLPPSSPVRNHLTGITQATHRAADLTRQMLAYSGKGKFLVESLDLSCLIEEIDHLIAASVSKKAELDYHLVQNLPAVEADATQIRQVIMNLIANAAEAIGEGSGIISISTGAMDCDRTYLMQSYLDEALPAGTYVYVEVTDTGSGMDEQTRAKIFDPFFTTKFTGRGLGLAAVLGIVRGHRGAINVGSEPQRGTTIRVLFPACRRPAAAPSGPGLALELPGWRSHGTVLLVDDEETVLKVARDMLGALGFEVLTAEDGRQAVEVFARRADEIRLVLLDMAMPRMDGEEAFREIRRIRPEARVLLSSGYNEQTATNRFAGRGLAGFIQKPYRLAALREKIRNVLER